jgi:cyclopropane fatty-acyl-phospholipid synthase-like methyltransferase
MRDPKAIVREGYDAISLTYRREDFIFENTGYQQFLAELDRHLPEGGKVLDLGCGCGIPTARHLAKTHDVVGVDISQTQIARAQTLVPSGEFLRADMTEVEFPKASFDAIVSLFAIIHVPLEEQPALFKSIAAWLKHGGLLLVTLGAQEWTGTMSEWHGAEMYWSHAGRDTYVEWLTELGFTLVAELFLPEGDSGHPVFLARKSAAH